MARVSRSLGKRTGVAAALAAIGAFHLAAVLAGGVALELWTSGRIVFSSGPPRFEPTLAVAAFAGAFVGWQLGRWRGLLGPFAYALFTFLLTLRYPVENAVRCAGGQVAACPYAWDLDFVIPQSWLVPGFVAGVVLARLVTWRVPSPALFEAAAVIALVVRPLIVIEEQALRAILLGPDGIHWYPDVESALRIALQLGAAVGAGIVLARRSARPVRDALVLAGLLIVAALPEVAYQIRFPEQGVEVASRFRRFAMAALVIATAGSVARADSRATVGASER